MSPASETPNKQSMLRRSLVPVSEEAIDPFTRTQIHVAAGMVAIQLGITADEGVDRLRAHAYACARPVSSVAADIIARRMTFLIRTTYQGNEEIWRLEGGPA